MARTFSIASLALALVGLLYNCGNPNKQNSQSQNQPQIDQGAIRSSSDSQTVLQADPEKELDSSMDRVFLSLSADATTGDVKGVDPSASPSPNPSESASPDPGAVDGIGCIMDKVFKLKEQVIAQILKVFDADKDGKISKAELLALIMAKQEKFLDKFSSVITEKCAQGQDADLSGRCQKLLKKFDADKDGKLSDAEMQALEKAKLDKMVEKRESWVMSVAARICMNNAQLCDQTLLDELKASGAKADKGLLDKLNSLVEKFLGKATKMAQKSSKDLNSQLDKPDQKK